MSATAQCQKPDWVGASGSYMVTAKLFVSAGAPDQLSCGDVSCPPGTPNAPDIWAAANGWPSFASALVRVKRGTSGIRSKGSLAISLLLGGWTEFTLSRSRYARGGDCVGPSE